MADGRSALRRDLVVIGSSAGGVAALPRVIQRLPACFPAAVCVVQHLATSRDPRLVDIIGRGAELPVVWGEQGAHLECGTVYVAPPDVHLVFVDDHIQLAMGPRENYSRPSIDKMFRSAAAVHGGRTIGVLLTGMLADGVAGLRAIRDAGGVVIVQDPEDAAFPDLPTNALRAIEPDRTLPLDDIAATLVALAGSPARPAAVPPELTLEARLDREGGDPRDLSRLGTQTTLACPECSGPLWEVNGESPLRYRCYLGHGTNAHELLSQNSEQIEQALWSAVRALSDRAATLEALALEAAQEGNVASSESYAARARDARTHATVAREFMFDAAGRVTSHARQGG